MDKKSKLYSFLKINFYYFCRTIGLFKLSSYFARRALRIICYHGFEIDDESGFRPMTFIKTETFRKRLDFLKSNNFNVIGIKEALELIKTDDLPPDSVVITIDDGFYSTYKIGVPILREYSFPAVVYVTTYYVINQTPVFRLAVQYIFWKTTSSHVNTSQLGCCNPGTVNITNPADREKLVWEIIDYGENRCDKEEREKILLKLGEKLDVSLDHIKKSRMLNMMNPGELTEIQQKGITLELHTHRHHFPADKSVALSEIDENRKFLDSELGIQTEHFCYPSGLWKQIQIPWLENAGIKSAVTCDPGLNYSSTHKFALNRFLDGENISQIEFQAELYGFSEFMRKLKRTFTASAD